MLSSHMPRQNGSFGAPMLAITWMSQPATGLGEAPFQWMFVS
jgi:hypothetical protein